ncbi:hypothetical protein ACN28S_23865 [Cystobacter fuscus]
MAAATPEEASRYREQVAELKRQYGLGLLRAGLATLAGSGGNIAGLVYQALTTGVPAAQDMESARQQFVTLESRYLPWVLAGQRADGSAYNPELFVLAGRDIAQRIQQATGEAWDSSLFAALSNVPHDTATTAKEAAAAVSKAAHEALAPFVPDPEARDSFVFWLKVGVGATAVVAVAGALTKLVRSFE